ncbi:MAG: T9SS type A sorting domain-containing protein [Bacteroidota bacterium]
MKKKILILVSISLFFVKSNFAQLANGSTAPNFTLTDINGNQQDLYSYLDAGKTVYIDFFACHCPFCWNYHNTHSLADLYNQYGPGTSANDVFVMAIELDANNGANEFNGISGYTQGNWVQGTNYPQINPEGAALTQIVSAYSVDFYPMIYAICPDKTITLIGTQSTSNLYNHTASCITASIDESTINFENTKVFVTNDKLLKIQSDQDLSSYKIEIVNMLGEKVLESNFSEALDISNLQSSVYFVAIAGKAGQLVRKILTY